MLPVIATTDWLDPNWRHGLSNAVIAWVVIGILGGILFVAWFGLRQIPKLSLPLAIALSAAVSAAIGAGVGGLVWHAANRAPHRTAVRITVMAGALKHKFIPEISREGIKVEMILTNDSFPDTELQNVAGQFWVESTYLIATIRRTPSPLDHPWEKEGDDRVQYRIWHPVLVKTGYEWLPTLVLALPPPGKEVHFGAQLVSKTTDFRQFRWTLQNKDGEPVITGGDATPSGLTQSR